MTIPIPRRRLTRDDRAAPRVAAAVPLPARRFVALGARTALSASCLIAVLATPVPTPAAQEVIELPADDRLLDADFEEIYRLGSVDGGGWDTFGSVESLGFDGAGNLYILDTQAVRISVVDREGNLVRQFIGEGEGPGEFGRNSAGALEFAVMRDGRVAIYDPGQLAFALFSADGEFERTVPMGGDRWRQPMLSEIQAFPGMKRVLSTTRVIYFSPPDAGPGRQFRYVLSYDLGGHQAAVDTAATAWKRPSDRQVFAPELMAGALPGGGIAFSDSSAYAIKFAAPGGRVTRIATRPLRPRPVTNRMRTEEIERRLKALETRQPTAGDPAMQAAMPSMIEAQRAGIEAMEFYPVMPVVLALRTDWEGTIWVRRRGDEVEGDGGPIDLITADGRYLGTLAPGATPLPEAFGPDGLVAFVEKDDLDVPYVVVKRFQRPEGASE